MAGPATIAQGIPTLETPRLRLRAHRREDFPDCAALWADPVVTRFIGGKPLSREEAWLRLLRYAGHWQWLGFGFWALEEKSTGLFAGELGYVNYHRELDPPVELRLPDGNTAPEVGWVLAPRFHGKGYATEGVRAALCWGDTHFGSSRSYCLVDPDNAPSIRVAEKCGFSLSHRATYKGEPTLVFTR